MTVTITKNCSYYCNLFKSVSFRWTFFCFLLFLIGIIMLFLIGIIMFSGAIGYYYTIFSNADIEKPDNEMFNVIKHKEPV